jgi:hypothetical protein
MGSPIIFLKNTFFNRFLWLFATFLIFSSCNKHSAFNDLSKEEKKWMSQFFNELLFVEGGVYTLLGSKPMTRIPLTNFTEEEKKQYFLSLSKNEQSEAQYLDSYTLPMHWNKWKEISNRFPLKRYLLIEKTDEENEKHLYFINILHAAIAIQENYTAFRNVVPFDFNPLEAILEIEDEHSPFWKAIEGNALLSGLLLGYGKVNAYAFQWQNNMASTKVMQLLNSLQRKDGDDAFLGKVQFSPSHFDTPSYICFENDFETRNQYRKERKAIKKLYKGKEFLTYTLEILTH